MRLRAFHAADGDCLLLTSSDGHHALVDGGRARTFDDQAWPVLRQMAVAGEPVDLVVVSHIDADHIDGVIRLIQDEEVPVEIGDGQDRNCHDRSPRESATYALDSAEAEVAVERAGQVNDGARATASCLDRSGDGLGHRLVLETLRHVVALGRRRIGVCRLGRRVRWRLLGGGLLRAGLCCFGRVCRRS